MSHSNMLAVAYAATCLLWLGACRVLPYWRTPTRITFQHPWREVAYALLAVTLVIGLGQLWVRGIRLPIDGKWRPVFESINQLVIFSPMLLLLAWRHQSPSSAWLPTAHALPRFAVGLTLSVVALAIYTSLEQGAPAFAPTVRRVFDPHQSHLAVQVFLEDISIAILFVRLAAAVTTKWAVLAVAALFAAAHIPTMLADGASLMQLTALLRDFALTALVLSTAARGADILWLFPVHYALDMTQFLGVVS